MPDVPRTLYAACPPVKAPFVRAFTDKGRAERAPITRGATDA